MAFTPKGQPGAPQGGGGATQAPAAQGQTAPPALPKTPPAPAAPPPAQSGAPAPGDAPAPGSQGPKGWPGPAAKPQPQDPARQALELAQQTLADANRRLMQAMVAQQAPAAGLTARGAEAATRLWDFAPCVDEGGCPDAEAVAGRLRQFAQSWPEFAAPAAPAPYAAGTGRQAIAHDTLKEALGLL